MSEGGDYTPATWSGADTFDDARRAYQDRQSRSYEEARAERKTVRDVLPALLETDSPAPLLIVLDQTGSMGDWTAVIAGKLPYLDHECRTEYLGPRYAVSYLAFDDVKVQADYPLQARPFAQGEEAKGQLEQLVHTNNGGGNNGESSELMAFYVLRCVRTPNAERPVIIFITDEMPHAFSAREAREFLPDGGEANGLTTERIFRELMERFEVFVVLKPYENCTPGGWERLVGKDRVVPLSEPGRVVDVLFGLLAKVTDRIAYFREEIEGRQTPAQVASTYEALRTVHGSVPSANDGRSTMHRPPRGSRGGDLM